MKPTDKLRGVLRPTVYQQVSRIMIWGLLDLAQLAS